MYIYDVKKQPDKTWRVLRVEVSDGIRRVVETLPDEYMWRVDADKAARQMMKAQEKVAMDAAIASSIVKREEKQAAKAAAAEAEAEAKREKRANSRWRRSG